MRTFPLDDEAGFQRWLREHPRALVLWRGEECRYTEEFEPSVRRLDPGAWALAARWVEHGGEGPVGDRYRLEVTPTIVAYRTAAEVARLEAKVGVGLDGREAQRWMSALP